jgi:hypothetical protein
VAVGQCVKDKSKNKDPASTTIYKFCIYPLTINSAC